MGIGWESVPLERRATRGGKSYLNARGLCGIVNKERLDVRTLTRVVEKYPGDAKSSGVPVES